MKKKTMVVILIMLIVAITLGSVVAILSNDKHHLTALIVLNGWEIYEITEESITFITETKNVTFYNFGYGIEQIKEGVY